MGGGDEDEQRGGDGEYLRKVRWNKMNVRHSAMVVMPILPSVRPGTRRITEIGKAVR